MLAGRAQVTWDYGEEVNDNWDLSEGKQEAEFLIK